MSARINAMRVLTDPAETGAVTLCRCRTQGEAWDYPESFRRAADRLDRPASAASWRDAVAVSKPAVNC